MDKNDTGVIFMPWVIETAETLITNPLGEEITKKMVSSDYYEEIVVCSENYIG